MLFYHHSIVEFVLIRDTLGVLLLVVLLDQSLATILDILPVCFEANVVNRIAIEHKLCWRCAHGGVYCGTHCEADSRKDSIPSSIGEVLARLDALCSNQVVNRLVSSLNH